MWGSINNGVWCALDLLQTYNGAVTALATLAIAWFTCALFWASRNQMRLQRAYVFGGCGVTFLWGTNNTPPPIGPHPEIWVWPDYHNDGLTPALIEELLWVTCRETELPSRANFNRAQQVIIADEAPPDKAQRRIPIDGALHIPIREDNLMFYGRFYYRDMVGKRRYSSFIYRFRSSGAHERVLNVHRSYWKWT